MPQEADEDYGTGEQTEAGSNENAPSGDVENPDDGNASAGNDNSGADTFYAKLRAADNFVLISGDTFTMGSPASERNRESDEEQHSVTVSSFYMSKYEVTQKEFADVMGQLPALLRSGDDYDKGDNYPVYYVSWYDAIAYCNKLSIKDGLTPAYSVSGISDWVFLAYGSIPTSNNSTWNAVTCNFSASGYRLPTEAEWEFACRAGTTTAWSTGDSEDDALKAAAWYWGTRTQIYGQRYTQPVGTKTANAWGLYDMHGNVWEWCRDWYNSSYYSSSPSSNPTGASSGSGPRGTRRQLAQ